MNEKLNLEELLQGVEPGTEFYSPIFGPVRFVRIIGPGELVSRSIACEYTNEFGSINTCYFAYSGKYYDIPTAECMLYPSKDEHDWAEWEKWKDDLPAGTPVLYRDGLEEWKVGAYLGKNRISCRFGVERYKHIIPLTPDLDMNVIAGERMPGGVTDYGTSGKMNGNGLLQRQTDDE